MVAVVSLSASSTMIGLPHPQLSGGALILAQAEIKFIVIKSVQMGRDFRQPSSMAKAVEIDQSRKSLDHSGAQQHPKTPTGKGFHHT